ncbi:unnamed protein product [Protopolystoma xenopodis]|uniref:Uncharacterized protein n=1 Tax=Protopolystoma xenopodis TaxID=117903 RepID=A0A448XRV8_9PLAT|nr:unnamed protein product [Protopolystoma xenopodis]
MITLGHTARIYPRPAGWSDGGHAAMGEWDEEERVNNPGKYGLNEGVVLAPTAANERPQLALASELARTSQVGIATKSGLQQPKSLCFQVGHVFAVERIGRLERRDFWRQFRPEASGCVCFRWVCPLSDCVTRGRQLNRIWCIEVHPGNTTGGML